MAKSGIHEPNCVTERVLATIATLTSETFGTRSVLEACPGLTKRQIQVVFDHQTKRKALEHTGRGQYKKGGLKIKASNLPRALVSEAVFAVLHTDLEHRHRSLPEITGEAEAYIGRPRISICDSVAQVLAVWHASGHLERIGKRGEYRHRLREGVIERPVYVNPWK